MAFLLCLWGLFLSPLARACGSDIHHHHSLRHLKQDTATNNTTEETIRFRNFQEWTSSQEFQETRSVVQCGSEEPNDRELSMAKSITDNWLKSHSDCTNNSHLNPHCPKSKQSATTNNTPIRIPVKWHSIGLDDGSGIPTDQQILDSIEALNRAFSHSTTGGFRFDFDLNTDKTESFNTEWHSADSNRDIAYKSVLRQGDCTTLNIYSTGTAQGVFGWGSKPHRCDDAFEECFNRCLAETVDDGVVFRYELVAGGPIEDYNEGDVLVHEVGHWLGLYHTFQNGCSAPGDFIWDTPAEAEPALGCTEVKDTCTGENDFPSGPDPIHNYMNLSNDPCMFEFTDGQFAWMYAQWEYFRAGQGGGWDELVPQNVPVSNEPPPETSSAPSFLPTTDVPSKEPSSQPSLEPSASPTQTTTAASASFTIILPTPNPTSQWSPAHGSMTINLPARTSPPSGAPSTTYRSGVPSSAPSQFPSAMPSETTPGSINTTTSISSETLVLNSTGTADIPEVEEDTLPPGMISPWLRSGEVEAEESEDG